MNREDWMDPDARYWDHDDPLEDEDALPVVIPENSAMVSMAEMLEPDTCPF